MKYRILVVDDDEMNLLSTQFLLEEWGYSVDTAKSGDEAISKVQLSTEGYAVILLDYRMPGKNGSVTAQEIHAINQESIILIYSCDDSREALKDAFKSGAVDFIEKSENIENLR